MKRGLFFFIGAVLLITILSLTLATLAQSSELNTKDYNEETRTATIKDNTDKILATAQLKTPSVVYVDVGKDRLVAVFEVENYEDNYESFIKQMEFYDIASNGLRERDAPSGFKYRQGIVTGQKEIIEYDWRCTQIPNPDGNNKTITETCGRIETGSHSEDITEWQDLDLSSLKSGKITIGLFADVEPGDKVEWIPTLFGVRIDEWAGWEAAVIDYKPASITLVSDGMYNEPSGQQIYPNYDFTIVSVGVHGGSDPADFVYIADSNQYQISKVAISSDNTAYWTAGEINFTTGQPAYIIVGDYHEVWRKYLGLSYNYTGTAFNWTAGCVKWSNGSCTQLNYNYYFDIVNITTQREIVNVAPNVNLISPQDGYNQTGLSVMFNCTASDTDNNLANLSLYINGNLNLTITGNSSFAELYRQVNLSEGTHSWTCRAVDNQNEIAWGVNRTLNLSIATAPPETSTPTIIPSQPNSANDLQCYANLTDDYSTTLTAYWKWYKNNVINLSGNTSVTNGAYSLITTLSSGNTTKGEQWFCNVTPFDGYNNGTAKNSSSVIILNSIPTQDNPLLKTLSGKNFSYENLTCYNQLTYDADNDNVTNIYNWYKNSQPLTVLNMPFEINADDYSGENNDGTIYGNPQFVTGKYGKALQLDGVDDYIFISDSNSLDFTNKKTWQLWFKRASTGAEILFDKGNLTYSNYKLEFLSNNKLKFSYSLALGLTNYLWQVKTKDNFDEGTYIQTYYNTTDNAVVLDSFDNGNYTSKVFNSSEQTLSFNSLSWSADIPTSAELSPEENMVGLWHFNEGSGNTTEDATTNNNDGTIYGASWTSQGKFNNALDFDGSNDYINFGNTNNFERTDSFSYSFWIKTNSTTNYITIMSKTPYGSWQGMETFVFNGKIRFYLIGAEEQLDVSSTSNINTGTWKYVVITYNGNSAASGVKIYVDGVEGSSGTGTLTTSIVNSNNFQVSCRAGAYNCFYGIIDEVAIWNKVLSLEEIQEQYNKGLGILTNLSLSVRSCTQNDCSDKGANWDITNLVNPPIDISSLTNNKYFQFKAELLTNDTDYSPKLYNATLNYSAQIVEQETNITSTSAITDNNWHLATVTYDTNNNLSIYINDVIEASKIETDLPAYKNNNLFIGKYFNGTIDEFKVYQEALSLEQIQSHYNNLEYNKIVSQETSGGDNYMCQVTPNDAEADGITKNSSSLNVLLAITFDVTSSKQYSPELDGVNIHCNYTGFNQEEDNTNPYGLYGFPSGNWECNFTKDFYFDKIITFVADTDKVIPVLMSETGGLTFEEHTWLEWLYNCWHDGECWNLLQEVNQTTTQIWQRMTGTDTSVITQEKVLSYTLSSTSNISINYTIEVPYKQGVAVNELLPIRMYFWFTNPQRTVCYSQDKGTNTNRAEAPYCLPLVAEILGPNDGTTTFKVDLKPNLPEGTYNITRSIEIDPLGIWTQYGREDIGQIEILSSGDASISLLNENRVNKATSTDSSSTSSSSSSSSSTNENKKDSSTTQTSNTLTQNGESSDKGETIQPNKPGITGAAIGAGAISGWQIVAITAIIAGLFLAIIICQTIIRIKSNSKKDK